MSKPKPEISTRYALFGGLPDPKTVCRGPCEGMGVYPVMPASGGRRRARRARFVRCPRCGGTGKEPARGGKR